MAAFAITGFFAEGRVVLLSDIHRVFAWFARQDRRSGKARAIVCLECPLSNYPWSLEIAGFGHSPSSLSTEPNACGSGPRACKLMTACGTPLPFAAVQRRISYQGTS